MAAFGFAKPNCAKCPFAVKGLPPHSPVLGRLPLNPIGVLVGEGPGREEVEAGAPFVGTTGRQLDIELAQAGVRREQVMLLTATACLPPKGKTEAMMRAAVDACRPLFDSQRGAVVKPALLMGAAAVRAWTGKSLTVEPSRGFIRGPPHAPHIITWHPTFAFFRNPWAWAEFTEDLRRLVRLIHGGPKHKAPRLIIDAKERHVREMIALGRTGVPITVDIETAPALAAHPWTGKDPTRARLKTVQVGCLSWGISVVWHEASLSTKYALKRLLADEKIQKWFHNGFWFDLRVLARYGLKVTNVEDTRDARKAICSTSRLSLRYLASLYNDTNAWKEEDEEGDQSKGFVFTKDMEALQLYGAQDTVETARVVYGITNEVQWDTKRVQRLYEVKKGLSQLAAEMHTRGFHVNEGVRVELASQLESIYDNYAMQLREKAKLEADRAVTPNVMRSLVYARHKTKGLPCFELPDPIDPKMYTDDEMTECAVDKPSLLRLYISSQTPQVLKEIFEEYWKAEAAWKVRSTYLVSDRVLHAIGRDGRLRAGWNSCGTETFRWSCSEPNLMNLSESKKEDSLSGELPNVRAMYGAAPGRVLVHADYSQQELRVMAAVSGDAELQRGLATGDVYNFDARAWFVEQLEGKEEVPKAIRKACKIIHLGFQYGAGTDAIFGQALIQDRTFKYSAARLLHEKAKALYSRTVAWWAEEAERVQLSGYSEGRILQNRRYYPREPPPTETSNYPIQTTAAEMTALAMLELNNVFKTERIDGGFVTIQHDAFDVEVREDQAERVAFLMKTIMPGPWRIEGKRHEFPIEVKVGTSWAGL